MGQITTFHPVSAVYVNHLISSGNGEQLVPVDLHAAVAERLRVLRGQQLRGRERHVGSQDPHNAAAQEDQDHIAHGGARVRTGRVRIYTDIQRFSSSHSQG